MYPPPTHPYDLNREWHFRRLHCNLMIHIAVCDGPLSREKLDETAKSRRPSGHRGSRYKNISRYANSLALCHLKLMPPDERDTMRNVSILGSGGMQKGRGWRMAFWELQVQAYQFACSQSNLPIRERTRSACFARSQSLFVKLRLRESVLEHPSAQEDCSFSVIRALLAIWLCVYTSP
jgi:hypothetical protein